MYFTWSQSMRIAFRFDGLTVRVEALLKFRQDFKQYSEVKNSAYLLTVWYCCGLKSKQTKYKMNLCIVWGELCRKFFFSGFWWTKVRPLSWTFGDVWPGLLKQGWMSYLGTSSSVCNRFFRLTSKCDTWKTSWRPVGQSNPSSFHTFPSS